MKFNLIVDIPDKDLQRASRELGISLDEMISKANNTCYLGMDCINAMLHRQYDLEAGDWYVSSVIDNEERVWAD